MNEKQKTNELEEIDELCSKIQNSSFINTSSSTSSKTRTSSTSASSSEIIIKSTATVIICDAWYGFPLQKRPRQERILGVSRQIYNFISWNDTYFIEQKRRQQQQQRRKVTVNVENDNQNLEESSCITTMENVKATIYVVGKEEDVQAIKVRIDELSNKNKMDTKSKEVNNGDDDNSEDANNIATKCVYLPGVALESLCEKLIEAKSQSVTYLSPDASKTLNPIEAPPSIIVVGMLVDRKVQSNRSKHRAEQITTSQDGGDNNEKDDGNTKIDQKSTAQHIRCARLPLDVLNVSDLGSDEALNIDTVMEMTQRWWYNHGLSQLECRYKVDTRLFADAAARALLTHRGRHPNRLLHGNGQDQ